MNRRFYYKLFINHTPKLKKSFFETLATYKILPQNFEYSNSSTYIVAKVKIDDKIYFFKECFPYYDKKTFLSDLIKDFFSKNAELIEKSEYIKSVLTNRKGIKRFFMMGNKNDAKSNLNTFLKTGEVSIVGYGMPKDKDDFMALKKFILFCWGNVSAYSMYDSKFFRAKSGYNTYNANRAIAQKIIDGTLGTNLLVGTHLVKLITAEKVRLGVLTDFAVGVNPNNLSITALKNSVSPSLQKQLNNLNIIDALCLEKDHGPNNYNVVLDENGLTERVWCFDNDSTFSFYPIPSCRFFTYSKVSPIIDKKGRYCRKYVDRSLFDSIMNLDIKNLKSDLKPYLNFFQFVCLKSRIVQLKKAMLKSLKEETLLILSDNEWNDETIDYEINKAEYNSYLRLYSSWLG